MKKDFNELGIGDYLYIFSLTHCYKHRIFKIERKKNSVTIHSCEPEDYQSMINDYCYLSDFKFGLFYDERFETNIVRGEYSICTNIEDFKKRGLEYAEVKKQSAIMFEEELADFMLKNG